MITVFTPTYNREKFLTRLYRSLCDQTVIDFEWVIVDDGSTDGTESLCESFILERKIPIQYVKQKNGGKHRAINKGVSIANGDLFFIVDSDDFLRKDAIQLIKKNVEGIISGLCPMAGVCGLRVFLDGKLVGTTFDGDYLDITTYERRQYGISGDKAEVVFTDLLKQFPFPEIDGEYFCPEALVWNRIAEAGYRFRYFNEGIYYCDYQQDGLTSQIDELLVNNYSAYSIYAKELIDSKSASSTEKLKCLCNAVRRARMHGLEYKQISEFYGRSIGRLFFLNVAARIIYFLRRK